MSGVPAGDERGARVSGSREPKRTKGLVIVFTGNGKGKTTAAMGMALRATGNGMRVRIIQFIKGAWRTGEVSAIEKLAPLLAIERAGRGFTIERLRDERISDEEHQAAARAGITRARELLGPDQCEMLVLDEILGAIKAGLVSEHEVLDLMALKPAAVHLVLTGRDAPPAIVDAADLVSEMRLIKHPFADGIVAQKGVEF